MHRTQIYLTEQQQHFLMAEAQRAGISLSEKIRQLIDELRPRDKDYAHNPLFALGSKPFTLPNTQGSENADAAVYGEHDESQ